MADGQKHVTFMADGVPVTFPYQPYDIQRDYVESVVRAANRGQNALLESPTGTGKTLSLLCSSLAWQQAAKTPNRMIYYTSRTHIQLNQAAKEMKKTAYAGTPAVVLGSRVHMCLNDEVKSQAHGQDRSINRACHNAIAKKSCEYYMHHEEKLKANIDVNKVHDIEDLHQFGRMTKCCPYYASRKLAETKASVVFMPYNYLIDLSIQKTVKLRVNNSIVIFDEGHNIESAFKDSASAQFTETCLSTIQDSCSRLPEKLSDALNNELHGLSRSGYDPANKRGGAIVDEFSTKRPSKKSSSAGDEEPKTNPIEELAMKLTNERLQQVINCAISLASCKDMMKSPKGEYADTKCSIDSVYSRLNQAGITFSTSDRIVETLEAMASFWSIAGVMSPTLVAKYLGAVRNLAHFISIMFPLGFLSKQGFDKHVAILREFYVAYLVAEFEKAYALVRSNTLINWTMHLWCLHPAIGLKRVISESCIDGPRSLIITSGTLAPMKQIETELEVKFPIIKEFDHLISAEQFKILIIGESPGKYSLQSTHKDTSQLRYPHELGQSLLRLFRVLPFGTLVFFPSYPLMDKVFKYWKSSRDIWDQMTRVTRIFVESQNQSSFSDDMINYKKTIDENKKAVFLGVFRGKLSEGTNLQANHCRSVIIIGLPFPSIKDPRVIETRRFHGMRGDSEGSIWYTCQMRRALGQAVGRVIRSRSDFGMLFLCDPRFAKYKYGLSKWISKFYPDHSEPDYDEIAIKVRDFFMTHDIDISAMCIADTNHSEKSAFEFDPIKPKKWGLIQSAKPNVNSYVKSNGFVKTSYGNGTNTNQVQPTNLQEKLRSQYVVDRETYQKAQEKRRQPNGGGTDNGQIKKLKSNCDTKESLWDGLGLGTAPQSMGVQAPEVIEIQDDDNDNVNHADNYTHEAQVEEIVAQPEVVPQTKSEPTSRNMFASGKSNKRKPKTKEAKQSDAGDQAHICFVCLYPAKPGDPICLTNCKCARRGHRKCMAALNKIPCPRCEEVTKKKNYKPLEFN